jgi:hypothetical protein
MRTITGPGLSEAIKRAVSLIERRRAEKTTCPKEYGGCGTKRALLSLSDQGVCVGKLCGVCLWCSLTDMPALKTKEEKALARKRKVNRKR